MTVKEDMLAETFAYAVDFAGRLYGWSEAEKREVVDVYFEGVNKIKSLTLEDKYCVMINRFLKHLHEGTVKEFFEEEKENFTLSRLVI